MIKTRAPLKVKSHSRIGLLLAYARPQIDYFIAVAGTGLAQIGAVFNYNALLPMTEALAVKVAAH